MNQLVELQYAEDVEASLKSGTITMPKIVNGIEVNPPNKYPYATYAYGCGASLVAPNVLRCALLTAKRFHFKSKNWLSYEATVKNIRLLRQCHILTTTARHWIKRLHDDKICKPAQVIHLFPLTIMVQSTQVNFLL